MKKIILFFSLILISCGDGNVKNDLSKLISRAIEIPNNAIVISNGSDAIINDYFESDYKMVVYTDSTSCSGCVINKLFLWQDIIEWSDKYSGILKYYFIFNPPRGENICLTLRNSMLDYPMLLDSLGEFERLNPHLPKNKAMHTFLLDENNNVVLVGNPLHNPKIEKMFKEIVEEKLGKKE